MYKIILLVSTYIPTGYFCHVMQTILYYYYILLPIYMYMRIYTTRVLYYYG